MKIFLVWSKDRSFEIAKALHDWLPRVIQAVKPFFSHEIEKGAKWSSEIDAALDGTHFGIVCLTPDNLESTWIHYETGALSKTKDALIWTYLSGLKSVDVPPPLGRFQHTLANREDTLRLLRVINKRLNDVGGESLPERLLEDNFNMLWTKLEEKLELASRFITESNLSESFPRKQGAMFEEILELLRSQQRRWDQFERNVVTIGNKKVVRVVFTIPSEPRVAEGNSTNPSDVALSYTQIFSELFHSEVTQTPTNDGLEMQISFPNPTDREVVRKGFEFAEKACGWRPDRIDFLKVP